MTAQMEQKRHSKQEQTMKPLRRSSLPARRVGRFGRADEGQALVLTALALVVLLMMAGLGVDVGYLKYQKQQMQKAADAGALAAASALVHSSDYVNAATNDTTANGFAPNQTVVGGSCSSPGTGICVAVNNPPQSGSFAGNNNYVEVIVSQARPTFFMQAGGFGSVNVSSRAVASAKVAAPACIYSLDPNPKDSGTLQVNGNVNLNSSCGVEVNSPNSDALDANGASGSLKASFIGVQGGYSGNIFSPTPTTGIPQFNDPFAGLLQPPTFTAPSPGNTAACTGGINTKITGGTANLGPGVYCGGIAISGNATVTFSSGTYILYGGGMSSGGNDTLTGNGVTFYNTGTTTGTYAYGPVNIAGTAQTVLTAPTSGALSGILFYQDPTITLKKNDPAMQNSFNGTNGATFTGVLYFPGTDITYSGNPTAEVSSIIVAWQLTFNGVVTLNDNLTDAGLPVLRSVALAE